MSSDTDDDDFDDDFDEDDDDLESPKPGNSLKWGLGAVIFLALVAIVLVAVVLFGGDPGKDAAGGLVPATPSSGAADAAVASSHDTGPVAVITEDPSCTAWTAMSSSLVSTLGIIGGGKWSERDHSIPASAWSPEERKLNLAAAQLIRSTAAQTVGLVKLTPHRVMRELYEQFIAYARAYAERVPNYTPPDNNLGATANSAASALAAICTAITDGSAASRGSMVEPQAAPAQTAPPGSPNNPQRFLTSPNPVCTDWKTMTDRFAADTAEWQQLDPNVPANFWSAQQKQVNLAVASVMVTYSNKMQQVGRRADNPVFQDFADLAAQYRRAFVLAVPTYGPADQHLANASTYATTTIMGACAAAHLPA